MFNEDTLEQAIIELLEEQWYTHCHGSDIHKEMHDVLLRDDLRNFLIQKYSKEEITLNEVEGIIKTLDRLPSSSLYKTNKEFMKMVSDGFYIKRDDKKKSDLFVNLIDCDNIDNNIFKIVNQLEIQWKVKRIPDGIIYVNGLPLVVFEFKSAVKEDATIENAYNQITIRYRRDIPELFKYNALCVISDWVNNRMGSFFAPYDFYYAWRKTSLDSKTSEWIDSLDTMILWLFNKKHLLEVIKDFIYFPDRPKDEDKIVCRYPQFYAAKKLFNNIKNSLKPKWDGKWWIYFWATGSGKSFTMLFLTRLLMRSKELENPTIVLITDRNDLDTQLSKQFINAKAYIWDDNVACATNREDLKDKLNNRESGWVFLTTIQKFTDWWGVLTDRSNVICISDEAHRTQTNLEEKVKIDSKKWVTSSFGFAKYLHDSLPNATYVWFTGTPIDPALAVFGPVIDSYTMKESVEDKITVRIVYEWRAAKVFLDNDKVSQIEKYYNECEELWANPLQIEQSKRVTTQMNVILWDKDVERELAKDLVKHYEERVREWGSVIWKAMFVAPNRPIAYEIYQEILKIRPEWWEAKECPDWVELTDKERKEIKPVPMINLVMTRWKDDPKELYELAGSDSYREEMARQFKNEKSNFKIAILVDMWLTGFDVPCLDTMYLYKPVQQHNLIQTISRVNRIYEWKESGLVVDYIWIKKNMNKALKKYAWVWWTDDNDFEDIEKAINLVRDTLDLLRKMFYSFDSSDYYNWTPLQKLRCLNRAVEYVQKTEEEENRFNKLVKKLRWAYSLCCSNEEITNKEKDEIYFFFAVRSVLFKITKWDVPDVSQMNKKVREMVEEAINSQWVEEIFKVWNEASLDIFSQEYLDKILKLQYPNTKVKLLEQLLKRVIGNYKKTNKIKWVDFTKKLKALIDYYNDRKDDLSMASEVLDDITQQFVDLYKSVKQDMESFKDMWIDFEEKAFYDILKEVANKHWFSYPEDKMIELAKRCKIVVDDKSKYTDWDKKADIKAELQVSLILLMDEFNYPPVAHDDVYKEIFEQAENFKKYANE